MTADEIRHELEQMVRTAPNAQGWSGLSTRELLILATRDRSSPGTEYPTELEQIAHIVLKATHGYQSDEHVFTTGWLLVRHLHYLAVLEISHCPVCWSKNWGWPEQKDTQCWQCREAREGLQRSAA